ncbi:MAG: dienelactone hydrolase family protein [Melioribacteraceae bacterium]|nr:dienelactone hydrolase family protein [Melioribacteraceae bacterium]
MIDNINIIEPHKGHPIFEKGESLENAKCAMIMIHGRGATAQSILTLADDFKNNSIAYLAPQAAKNTWYPYRFIETMKKNEPDVSSGLQLIDFLVNKILDKGLTDDKIFLLGFSQGACLALEYAARNPRNYAGIIGLSGGLMGPIGKQFNYEGSFTENTKVFLGCSDTDFHIPLERVNETADVFKRMGAKVKKEIYKNMGHTINSDEIETVSSMLNKVAG